jgi:hypothetical protein
VITLDMRAEMDGWSSDIGKADQATRHPGGDAHDGGQQEHDRSRGVGI